MSFSTYSYTPARAVAARKQSHPAPLRREHVDVDATSMVAHDFRSPLTSIMGYLEMLMDGEGGPLSKEQAVMLNVIERNSRHLLAISEDLLADAEYEVTAPVDLHLLIEEVGESFAPLARQLGIDFDFATSPDAGSTPGNAVQLRRVLANLLGNALKYTMSGGQVRLKVKADGNTLRLRVADSGIGIPIEEQANLFNPFYRATTALDEGIEGTGLGLLITKQIVADHDGSIAIHSIPGMGTTIDVVLPRYERDMAGRSI